MEGENQDAANSGHPTKERKKGLPQGTFIEKMVCSAKVIFGVINSKNI